MKYLVKRTLLVIIVLYLSSISEIKGKGIFKFKKSLDSETPNNAIAQSFVLRDSFIENIKNLFGNNEAAKQSAKTISQLKFADAILYFDKFTSGIPKYKKVFECHFQIDKFELFSDSEEDDGLYFKEKTFFTSYKRSKSAEDVSIIGLAAVGIPELEKVNDNNLERNLKLKNDKAKSSEIKKPKFGGQIRPKAKDQLIRSKKFPEFLVLPWKLVLSLSTETIDEEVSILIITEYSRFKIKFKNIQFLTKFTDQVYKDLLVNITRIRIKDLTKQVIKKMISCKDEKEAETKRCKDFHKEIKNKELSLNEFFETKGCELISDLSNRSYNKDSQLFEHMMNYLHVYNMDALNLIEDKIMNVPCKAEFATLAIRYTGGDTFKKELSQEEEDKRLAELEIELKRRGKITDRR